MTTVTFVHTVGGLRPVFDDLARELLPGAEVVHVVDEALLAEAITAGTIPDATAARLEREVGAAVGEGSDLVVVTCSSMGPAVEAIRARHGWPVLRIDEAMADEALATSDRIGVLATLRTTLEPTADLIRRRAGERPVEVVTHLSEGAFEALRAGDTERHDEAVRDGLRTLLGTVGVIVLAQASMARVAATLGDEAAGTPILASPRLGVERAARLLGGA